MVETVKTQLPEMFRPLLWSLRWADLDINEDKSDIITNTINDGTLAHWHWIIQTYGKEVINQTLIKRPITEFHPESYQLARVIFDLPRLQHAR